MLVSSNNGRIQNLAKKSLSKSKIRQVQITGKKKLANQKFGKIQYLAKCKFCQNKELDERQNLAKNKLWQKEKLTKCRIG